MSVEANLEYWIPEHTDILLAIEAAPTKEQRLLHDWLTVNSLEALRTVPGDHGIGRRT